MSRTVGYSTVSLLLVIWLFEFATLFFVLMEVFSVCISCFFFFVAVVLYHLPTLPNEKQEIKLYFVLNLMCDTLYINKDHKKDLRSCPVH